MTRTATVYQMRLKSGSAIQNPKFVFDRWDGQSDGWEWQHFGHIELIQCRPTTVTGLPTIRNLWAALTLNVPEQLQRLASLNPNPAEFALILSFESDMKT